MLAIIIKVVYFDPLVINTPALFYELIKHKQNADLQDAVSRVRNKYDLKFTNV